MEHNPKAAIASFVSGVAKSGYKGLELYVRVGHGVELAGKYVIAPNVADQVFEDAQMNAAGFDELVSEFMLKAKGDNGEADLTRHFSITRPPSPHMPDRFEGTDRAMVRLLLEQNERSHRIITQVVPQVMAHQAAMFTGLSGHMSEMLNTHGQALQVLRDGRVEQLQAEREMVREAAREQRIDMMWNAFAALAPQVIEGLSKGSAAPAPQQPPPPPMGLPPGSRPGVPPAPTFPGHFPPAYPGPHGLPPHPGDFPAPPGFDPAPGYFPAPAAPHPQPGPQALGSLPREGSGGQAEGRPAAAPAARQPNPAPHVEPPTHAPQVAPGDELAAPAGPAAEEPQAPPPAPAPAPEPKKVRARVRKATKRGGEK